VSWWKIGLGVIPAIALQWSATFYTGYTAVILLNEKTPVALRNALQKDASVDVLQGPASLQ
jgi:hypothetical protein